MPINAAILLCGPIPLIAPLLKVGFGPMRQEHGPCRLKVGACLVEGGGGAALVFARMRARIEAAIPLPRISIVRVAAADRDGPHAHVTVKDVPAFFAGIGRASAGECRHALSKRDLGGESKPGGAEKPVASFRVGGKLSRQAL